MVGPLLLPLLVLAGRGGGTTPHVQSVSAAVAGLSTEMGKSLEVERSLRDVPVLIDLPGQGPAQRLKELAFALRASIVQDGRTLRIERSPEDQKAVVAAHRRVLRRVIVAGFDVARNGLETYNALGDPAAQARAAQTAVDRVLREAQEAKAAGRPYVAPPGLVNPGALTPAGRLTFDIAQRIGAERLAELAPGEVQFFSNRPNAVERPLPPCDDLLAAYDRLQGVDVDRARKLILRAQEFGVMLRLYDARGRQVDAGGADYANRAVYLGPSLPPLGVPGAVWRPLDEPSRQLASFLHDDQARFLATYERGLAGEQPTTPVPEPFLHPERQDPLDFAVREAFLALPRAPKTAGMVAVLADWPLDLADECVRDGKLDATAFERGLLGGGNFGRVAFERLAQGGTTIVRPINPLAAEAALADRGALGASLRRVMADGRIDLLNWPAINLALYPSRNSPVTQRYLKGLLGHGLRRSSDVAGRGMGSLALVGATIRANRPVVEGRLPPFHDLLRDGLIDDWLDAKPGLGTSDLARAPSSLLASGALDRAQVAVVSTETVVADRDSTPTEGFAGLEPDRLGLNTIYMPGMPRTEERTKMLVERMYLKTHYRLGRRIVVGAEVRLEGHQPFRIELQDNVVDRAGLQFSDLPLTFRQGIMEGVRRMLEGTPVRSPGP